MFALSADTVNTLLNSLTALLIAAGGLGIGKLVKRGTDNVATETKDAGVHVVERLDSIDKNLRGLHAKVNGLDNRIDRMEGAEDG
jgi:hypothetical protein